MKPLREISLETHFYRLLFCPSYYTDDFLYLPKCKVILRSNHKWINPTLKSHLKRKHTFLNQDEVNRLAPTRTIAPRSQAIPTHATLIPNSQPPTYDDEIEGIYYTQCPKCPSIFRGTIKIIHSNLRYHLKNCHHITPNEIYTLVPIQKK